MKQTLFTLIILLFCSSVFAEGYDKTIPETKYYWGLQVGVNNYINNSLNDDAKSMGVTMIGGYSWFDSLSSEIRFGWGLGDSLNPKNKTSDSFNVGLTYLVSTFTRLQLNIFEAAKPYALIGFSHIDLNNSGKDVAIKDPLTDFSWGTGINFYWDKRRTILIEHVNYIDKEDSFKNITISYQYKL